MTAVAIRAGKAEVSIGVQDNLKKGLEKARSQLNAFANQAFRIGGTLTAVGGGIAAALTPAVMAASDFQETLSKFKVVFGDNQKAVREWGEEFAEQVGRSKKDVLGFLASTQDLLVPMGVDPGQAEELSKTIAKLTVDLASFNNMAEADVMRDLQAALTGSGETMKKYGVIVSQTAVNQRLLNEGMDPKTATEAEKAMARLNIILEGTTAAQGDALRTADSFANRMKALRAAFNDFLVNAGTPLLEMLADYVQSISDAIKWAGAFIKENASLVKVVVAITGVVGVAATAFFSLAAAAKIAAFAMGALATATGLVSKAMIFLSRNPLVAIITAIAALLVLVLELVGAWDALLGTNELEKLENDIGDLESTFEDQVNKMQATADKFSLDNMKDEFGEVGDAAKTAAERIQEGIDAEQRLQQERESSRRGHQLADAWLKRQQQEMRFRGRGSFVGASLADQSRGGLKPLLDVNNKQLQQQKMVVVELQRLNRLVQDGEGLAFE